MARDPGDHDPAPRRHLTLDLRFRVGLRVALIRLGSPARTRARLELGRDPLESVETAPSSRGRPLSPRAQLGPRLPPRRRAGLLGAPGERRARRPRAATSSRGSCRPGRGCSAAESAVAAQGPLDRGAQPLRDRRLRPLSRLRLLRLLRARLSSPSLSIILRPCPPPRPTAPPAADVPAAGDPGRALALAQELLDAPQMSTTPMASGATPARPPREPLTIQATGIGGPSAALVLGDLAGLGVRRAMPSGPAPLSRGSRQLLDAALRARPGGRRRRAARWAPARRWSPSRPPEARRRAARRTRHAAGGRPPTCSDAAGDGGRPRRARALARRRRVAAEMQAAALFAAARGSGSRRGLLVVTTAPRP